MYNSEVKNAEQRKKLRKTTKSWKGGNIREGKVFVPTMIEFPFGKLSASGGKKFNILPHHEKVVRLKRPEDKSLENNGKRYMIV
jgi:hypothetical protein